MTVFEAVRAFLQAQLRYPWWLVTADERTGQYGILEVPAWATAEPAVGGPGGSIDTDFRVKAVTGTIAGVGIMLANVRGLLWAGHAPTRVVVAGWHVETAYQRSELVAVDRDLVLPGTDRHPAYGVDTYRLTAQPL